MKRLLYLLLLSATSLHGQALRDINFRYLYSPRSANLEIRPVREASASAWSCHFAFTVRDTVRQAADFAIRWEIRNSLSDKEGEAVNENDIKILSSDKLRIAGTITIPFSEEPKYLMAKVTDSANGQTLVYYTTLQPNYPERHTLSMAGAPVTERFVHVNESLSIGTTNRVFMARYDDNFPTAPLAFSEALGKVSKEMKIDSTFTVEGGSTFSLRSSGLYLAQTDTTAAEGIAFRVESDYPRYSKLRNLAAPLIYICTSQEYEKLRSANGEKKAFDRVILSITKDQDRAKRLMRTYFKRVESANEYFTSYKEGWKTDRGMIFIVFGPPDEVFRFADREVWTYKHQEFRGEFSFVRSPSIFDPNNHVLVRSRKYKELWYEVVDMWRNARF